VIKRFLTYQKRL